jgi:hypothetical protein
MFVESLSPEGNLYGILAPAPMIKVVFLLIIIK